MLALNFESSYKANFVSKRAAFAFYSVSVKKKMGRIDGRRAESDGVKERTLWVGLLSDASCMISIFFT